MSKQLETCPLCSAPLQQLELYFSDGTKSPKQLRCSNQVCDGHRQPEKIQEQRKYLAQVYEKQKAATEAPKTESSSKR